MKLSTLLLLSIFTIASQLMWAQTKEEKKMQSFISKGNFEKAETYINNLKDKKTSYRTLRKCYTIISNAYLEKGDCENAIKNADNTRNKQLFEKIADKYADKNSKCYNVDKAIKYYTKVNTNHSKLCDLYFYGKNNPKKALTYTKAANCEKYGDILMDKHNIELALRYYNRFLDDKKNKSTDEILFLKNKGIFDYYFKQKEYQKGYEIVGKIICNADKMYTSAYPRTPTDILATEMLNNNETITEIETILNNNGLQKHVINITIIEALLHKQKYDELSNFLSKLDNKKGYFLLINKIGFDKNSEQAKYLKSQFKKYDVTVDDNAVTFSDVSKIMQNPLGLTPKDNDYILRAWKSIGTGDIYKKVKRINNMRDSKKDAYIESFPTSFASKAIKTHLPRQHEIASKLPPNVLRLLLKLLSELNDSAKNQFITSSILQISISPCYYNVKKIAAAHNTWAFESIIEMITAASSKVDLLNKLYRVYALDLLVKKSKVTGSSQYEDVVQQMTNYVNLLENIVKKDIVNGKFNTSISAMRKADLQIIKVVDNAYVASVKAMLINAKYEISDYKTKINKNAANKDELTIALSKLETQYNNLKKEFDSLLKSKRGDYFNKYDKKRLQILTAKCIKLRKMYVKSE